MEVLVSLCLNRKDAEVSGSQTEVSGIKETECYVGALTPRVRLS